MNVFNLMENLSVIYDARQEGKVLHRLSDILFLTISAVIAGAEGWDEIEDFGVERIDWLKQYGDFENGIPSYSTIAKVMSIVDPEEFQYSFIEWMKTCHEVTNGAVIAIDGKTAMPKLLDLPEITGCLVTVDAMGCQKDIARKIVHKCADYLFAVKAIKENCTVHLLITFQWRRLITGKVIAIKPTIKVMEDGIDAYIW